MKKRNLFGIAAIALAIITAFLVFGCNHPSGTDGILAAGAAASNVHFLQKTEGNGEVTLHWTETGWVPAYYADIPTGGSKLMEAGYYESSPNLDHIEVLVYDFSWWNYETSTAPTLSGGYNPYGSTSSLVRTETVPKGTGSHTVTGLDN
jgi:hypothetical protein